MTEEEVAWKMPPVDVGCTVKVWPNGREDGKPHHAFVARVSDRSIDVQSPLHTARGGIRHIKDPCLINTSEENRRAWGGWDYTDETKAAMTTREFVEQQRAALAAMEKRIKSLEELMDKKTK